MSELTNGQFNSCLKQFPSCNALLPPPLLTAYLNKHIRGAAVLLPLAAASLESFSAVLHFEDEPTPLPLERAAAGNNPMGMVPLKKAIAQTANAYVHSVELCSEPSKLENCDGEVDQFARVVKADPKLQSGFNAAAWTADGVVTEGSETGDLISPSGTKVGFSQGNTVIRGYIHKYNNPPVKTFLSMHGVLMGVNGLPQCPMSVPGLGAICRTVDALVSHFGVYSSLVQNRLAQANYYRDAENLAEYRSHGHFLPYINNEVQGQQNATYKKNFESLEKLVLVMAEDDTMVHPKESEHFGYFKDGSRTELVDMRDAPWYTEDWFGLKSLDVQSLSSQEETAAVVGVQPPWRATGNKKI
ncbi:Palmitoyl-protein thioesterase 1 (PPT-1) (Palmitoyl-protein hydrolase 1) [Durusdinium trenchii]|uniref:palmitoyl-CoA hydrolase n=1 Tax=Durusdinium trenchii TaxID=1381693 RepID=A0ABP0MZY7_9DINO